ncbi:disease resistance protein rga2, partial [Quercus suber]
ELNGLNNLRGTLDIKILEQLEDTNSNCDVKNLKEKQHLEKLELTWTHQEGHDEMLLDSLQPHPNLKILKVYGYTGVTFSSWLSSIKNLVDITLMGFDRCNHLPPLSKLPFLESLRLCGMKDLECISDRDISEEVSNLSFFPSLKFLWIRDCPNLKGWWRSASMTGHQHNMTSNSKLFQETIFPSSSSSSSSHLSKLNYMGISEILPDVVSPTDGEWHLNCLTHLETLLIGNCENLKTLPRWIGNLISLKQFTIYNCLNLKSLPDEMRDLSSLQTLEICN